MREGAVWRRRRVIDEWLVDRHTEYTLDETGVYIPPARGATPLPPPRGVGCQRGGWSKKLAASSSPRHSPPLYLCTVRTVGESSFAEPHVYLSAIPRWMVLLTPSMRCWPGALGLSDAARWFAGIRTSCVCAKPLTTGVGVTA